jgi:hypothetical protein
LIARLPKDAIPLVWGYEHDAPFARSCKLLQGSGLPFYVCPGTSSWCSFSGRSSTCLANIELAARIGHRCGGAGLLITDWGDFGHRQYLPVSYAGFLFGAAVAWCGASNQNLDVPAELSRHVFHDPSGNAGRAWFDAGTVHEASGIRLMNKTVLFRVMNAPLDDRTACADLMADQVDAMADRLRRTRKTASRAHFNTVDGPTVRDEMDATLAILDHACRRTRAMNSTGSAQRTWHSLAADMHEIMCRHRALWRARNRPGGLSESLTYYRRNLEEYEVRAGMRRRRRRQPRGG